MRVSWVFITLLWKALLCTCNFQGGEQIWPLTFLPSKLLFNSTPMYVTTFADFEVVNSGTDLIDVNWIKSSDPQFHPLMLEPISISSHSSARIQVVFLPQTDENIEANLTFITSEGSFIYFMSVFSTINPYRVKPLVFDKVVIGTVSLNHPIFLFNPHSDKLHVLEVHCADRYMQLKGVPTMTRNNSQQTPDLGMWAIESHRENHIISFSIDTNLPEGIHKSFVYIETDHDKLVVPLVVEMVPVSVKLAKPLNFGIFTQDLESRSLELVLSNDGPHDILVTAVRKLACSPDVQIQIQLLSDPILYHSQSNTPRNSVVAKITFVSTQDPLDFSGQLVISTNSSLQQFSSIVVPFNGSVVRGNVIYDEKETNFVINWRPDSWPDKIVQFIRLRNGYHSSAALNRLGLASCGELMKITYNGKQNVVAHGATWPGIRLELFTDPLKRANALPRTCWLEVMTNISSQRIPLHLVDGKLNVELFEAVTVAHKEVDPLNKFYDIDLGIMNISFNRDIRFIVSNRNSISNILNVEKSSHPYQLCLLSSWPIGRKDVMVGSAMIQSNFNMNDSLCGNTSLKPGYNALMVIRFDDSFSGVYERFQISFKSIGNFLHFDIHAHQPQLLVPSPSRKFSVEFTPSMLVFGVNQPLSVSIMMTDIAAFDPGIAISATIGSKIAIQSATYVNSSFHLQLLPLLDCFSANATYDSFIPRLWRCALELSNLSSSFSVTDQWEQALSAHGYFDLNTFVSTICDSIELWREQFLYGMVFYPGTLRLRTNRVTSLLELPTIPVMFPFDLHVNISVSVPDTDAILVRFELFNPSNGDIIVRLEGEGMGSSFIREVDVDLGRYFMVNERIPFSISAVLQSVSVLSPKVLKDGVGLRYKGEKYRHQRIPRSSRLFMFALVKKHYHVEQIKFIIANSWSGLEMIDFIFTTSSSQVDIEIDYATLPSMVPSILLQNNGKFPVVISDLVVDDQSCTNNSNFFFAFREPEYCNKFPLTLPSESIVSLPFSNFLTCSVVEPTVHIKVLESGYELDKEYFKIILDKNLYFPVNHDCLKSSSLLNRVLLVLVCVLLIVNIHVGYSAKELLSSVINIMVVESKSDSEQPIVSKVIEDCLENAEMQDPTIVKSTNWEDELIILVKGDSVADIPIEERHISIFAETLDHEAESTVSESKNSMDERSDIDDLIEDAIDDSVLGDLDARCDSSCFGENFSECDLVQSESSLEGYNEGQSDEFPSLPTIIHNKENVDLVGPVDLDSSLLKPISVVEYDSNWFAARSKALWDDELENDPVLNPSRGAIPGIFDSRLGVHDTTVIDRLLSDDEDGMTISSPFPTQQTKDKPRAEYESREWLQMNNLPRMRWSEENDSILYGPGSYFEKQTMSIADLVLDSDDD